MKVNNYVSNFFSIQEYSKLKKELSNTFFASKVFSFFIAAAIAGVVAYGATNLYKRVKKKGNVSSADKNLNQFKPKSKIKSAPLINESINFLAPPKKVINESIFQPIKLSSKKLIELKAFNHLEEEHFIYKNSLEAEKSIINEHLSISENKTILEYIIKHKNSNEDACAALWVILGIKPAAVFELNIEPELHALILNVLKLHVYKENLKLIVNHQKYPKYYFINEQPLEIFNPRRYLTRLLPHKQTTSITEAVTYCFPHQGCLQTDQILSYLLGFGPSWEAYSVNASRFPGYDSIGNSVSNPSFSCFSDEHYFEIGKVLNSLLSNTDSPDEINLGKAYHMKLPKLTKKLSLKRNSWIEDQKKYDDDHKNFKNAGIQFIFDRISAETDYFKKNYTLRIWVFQSCLEKA